MGNSHGSHFCQREGDHGRADSCEQTSVHEGGRTAIQQAELKRYPGSLPGRLESEAEVDDGCWVDISLHRVNSELVLPEHENP
jgi:hypothetical protein